MSLLDMSEVFSLSLDTRITLKSKIYAILDRFRRNVPLIEREKIVNDQRYCPYLRTDNVSNSCSHPNNGHYYAACCNEFLTEGWCMNPLGNYTPR